MVVSERTNPESNLSGLSEEMRKENFFFQVKSGKHEAHPEFITWLKATFDILPLTQLQGRLLHLL